MQMLHFKEEFPKINWKVQALQISDACRGMKQTAWKPSASMAMDVIAGEIRVLRSAAAWLRHQSSSNALSVS
jgi:hypothetical protein